MSHLPSSSSVSPRARHRKLLWHRFRNVPSAIAAAIGSLIAAVALGTGSFRRSAADVPTPLEWLPALPVSKEAVADAARLAVSPAGDVALRASAPALAILERAQAAFLWPLARRLAARSVPAPEDAKSALDSACDALKVRFPCPSLHVVVREEDAHLQTLPWGPEPVRLRRRRFAIFISQGLLAEASSEELEGLFLRELALIKMFHVRIPEVWALLKAIKPRPKSLRLADRGSPADEEEDGKGNAFSAALKASGTAFGQVVELARAEHGMRQLLHKVPNAKLPAPTLERPMSDFSDILATYGEHGRVAALRTAAEQMSDLEAHYELRRLARIGIMCDMLYHQELPLGSIEEMKKLWRDTEYGTRMAYRVGLERIERVVEKLVIFRYGRKRLPKPVPRKDQATPEAAAGLRLSAKDALMLGMSVSRSMEMAADKVAAEVLGSHEPLVAGLVRLHGSPMEKRRLARGDLQGLIEDAVAEYLLPRQRWATRWISALKLRPLPPLWIRIAELATWSTEAHP